MVVDGQKTKNENVFFTLLLSQNNATMADAAADPDDGVFVGDDDQVVADLDGGDAGPGAC